MCSLNHSADRMELRSVVSANAMVIPVDTATLYLVALNVYKPIRPLIALNQTAMEITQEVIGDVIIIKFSKILLTGAFSSINPQFQ